ncbi:MAG TPA: MFS transporter, partial [Verrucomicrobiae bacterium]|nr:MFS transporter [Verrucomicrobiae bacterium]
MDQARLSDLPYYRWIVLGICYLLMVLFAFPLQALPPMLEQIMSEIGFSHSMGGFLMGSYGIPGLIMPLAAAMLAARYDRKKLVLAGIGVMCCGLLVFCLAHSYSTLLAGRVLAGVGGKIILSLAPLFVMLFFEKANLGMAVGVFNTAVPVGSIVAMNLFGYLSLHLSWRTATACILGAAALMAAVVAQALHLPEGARGGQELETGGERMGRGIWALASVNFLVNVVTMAYITFAPPFFLKAGLSNAQANMVTSLLMVETALIGPLAGLLIDRKGLKLQTLTASALLMSAAFYFLSPAGPA